MLFACLHVLLLFLLGLPIYFFSVRLYPKTAHNSSVRIKTETVQKNGDAHHVNGKSNGLVNQAFREDEETQPQQRSAEKEEVKRLESPRPQTKYPAPPPPVAYESQTSSIDLDLALAALDDVLFVEENKNRKVSVGSVSNGSKGFNEHDVVALVHREDVISATYAAVVDENLPPLRETVKVVVVESVIAKPEIENLEELAEFPVGNSDTVANSDAEKLEEVSQPSVDAESRPVSSASGGEDGALLSPPPPPMPVFTSFEIPAIPRVQKFVTASDLKSVKLRSPRPESPPVDYDEPTNDNIAFGTVEHKNFKSRLEVVLSRANSMTPPITPVTPKSPRPKTVGPSGIADNEFVVQDRIRTSDARKTLSAFFLSDKAIFANGLRPNSNAPKVDMKVNSKSVENGGSKLNDSESLKLEHRQRMAGTLRSIRLRKVDSFKDDDTQ